MVRETNERAEDVLIENDILTEADLLKALSGIYRTHFVSTEKLSKADIPRATVQMIPRRVAETLGVFPVLFDRQKSVLRSEEHTLNSSHSQISYAVFCLKK